MSKKKLMYIPLMLMLAFVLLPTTSAFANTYTNGVSWSREANAIIGYAKGYMGTPYKFGAKYGNTSRFDCSSFTKWVYRNYRYLPRNSQDQAKVGYYVKRSNLRKGDLVFFHTPSRPHSIGHVGIYIGSGKILHTYGAGGVRISNMSSGYWSRQYVTARRILK